MLGVVSNLSNGQQRTEPSPTPPSTLDRSVDNMPRLSDRLAEPLDTSAKAPPDYTPILEVA